MTLKRFDGGSWIDLTTRKRFDGVSWINLTLAKRFDGSVWVDISLGGGGGSLSATTNFSSTVGSASSTGPGSPVARNVTSAYPITVSATGGTAPYTYLWSYSSGDSSTIPNSPTAASTLFHATLARNQTAESQMKCVVTDAVSATFTVYINCTLSYDYSSGGGGEDPL